MNARDDNHFDYQSYVSRMLNKSEKSARETGGACGFALCLYLIVLFFYMVISEASTVPSAFMYIGMIIAIGTIALGKYAYDNGHLLTFTGNYLAFALGPFVIMTFSGNSSVLLL